MEVRRRRGRPRSKGEGGEHLRDFLDHALEFLGPDFDAAMAFGQGDHTHGQRIPGADALAGIGKR